MNNKILTLASGITGDISTCKIETSQIISARPSFFIEEITTFAVNNCTGEVIQGSTYQFSCQFMSVYKIVVFVILVIFFVTALKVLCSYGNSNKHYE